MSNTSRTTKRDRTNPAGTNLSAISLFSGAGGLDLGLEAAGWRILAQIEMDPDSVDTLRLHAETRPTSTEIIPKRIEDVDPGALRKKLGLKKGGLALLAG